MSFKHPTRHRYQPAAPFLLLLWVLGAATQVQAESGRRIEHAFGETRIEGTPQRVITLYQGATDTAVALGIEPVGVVESWVEKPMYRYLRDALEGVAQVGQETQPNLEEIAWLKPDLIVATNHRHQQVRGLLAEIAPTVAPETVSDFKHTLEVMGKATNREARATALLHDWNRRVADLGTKLQRALDDQWPQEVAVIGFKSDHARIYYSGFAGSILNELGFRRPENHRRDIWGVKLTSQESIPAMNADVFFVFMDTADPAVVANFQRWQRHPLWQTLDAVEHDRVYQVDPVTWNMGGGILAANELLDDIYAHYDVSPYPGRSAHVGLSAYQDIRKDLPSNRSLEEAEHAE